MEERPKGRPAPVLAAVWPVVAAVLPVLVLLLCQLPPLWQLAGEPRLPQWDEAKYGVSGLRLAGALATADLPLLLRELNGLSVWPPVFPLLEAPAFLAFGKDPAVASRLVLILWAATLLLLPWALAPVGSRRSPAAGWLAAAALAAAPLFGSFAILAMLEIPGVFLLVVALGFSLRALRFEPGAWRAAYLASCLLFFCKYNYGLLFIVPLVLFRLRLGVAGWPELAAAALRSLQTWRRRLLLLAGGAALLALWALRRSGGFETEAFGQRISVSSIGQPVLIALWLALIYVLSGRDRRRAVWHRLTAIDSEHEGLLRYLAAPILLWFLLPPHLKDFLDFVENRSSALPLLSGENLLFYPRAFLEGLAPSPFWGVVILLAALYGLPRLFGSTTDSFLALWTTLACTAAFLHPYKQDRFFLPAAVALVILAAASFTRLSSRLELRVGGVPAAPLFAGLLALAAAAGFGAREEQIRREVATRSVPAAVAPAIDLVLEAGSAEPALLLGTWNLASPWLIEWRAWQNGGGWEAPRLPLLPRELSSAQDGAALAARLDRGPALILALEPLPSLGAAERGAFAAENAWQAAALARLENDPIFAAEPARELPAAGYLVRAWRRR